MRMLKNLLVLTVLLLKATTSLASDELERVLERAFEVNPEIQSYKAKVEAEKARVPVQYTMEDPMVGISTLNRGSETRYGVVSQKMKFPYKYYLMGQAQSQRVQQVKAQLRAKKMEVRHRVSSLYYSVYAQQKIIELTEANIDAVEEFARVAESKYSAGQAPQSDSMKAHFELTKLELDIIRLKQEEKVLQEKLKAELNYSVREDLNFSNTELGAPKVDEQTLKELMNEPSRHLNQQAPRVNIDRHGLEAAKYQNRLAQWEYAPDFQFQWQQRISGDPQDSSIVSVSLSFPLWFWRKGYQSAAATRERYAQRYKLKKTEQDVFAKVVGLSKNVVSGMKTLKIYKTSLIPQAEGAYNSARGAYRASKASFLNLLDSERSLYEVKKGFYKTLRQFVSQLTKLEAELGRSIRPLDRVKGETK